MNSKILFQFNGAFNCIQIICSYNKKRQQHNNKKVNVTKGSLLTETKKKKRAKKTKNQYLRAINFKKANKSFVFILTKYVYVVHSVVGC